MVAVRSMLARVRRLEIEKVHPILAQIGGDAGWAAVEADVKAGLADGRLDRRDMPHVMMCLIRWLSQGRVRPLSDQTSLSR